jgi:hypothetical protein
MWCQVHMLSLKKPTKITQLMNTFAAEWWKQNNTPYNPVPNLYNSVNTVVSSCEQCILFLMTQIFLVWVWRERLGYRLADVWLDSWQGKGSFLISRTSRLTLKRTQPHTQWVLGYLSLAVKQSWCKLDHSSGKVLNECSRTTAFMAYTRTTLSFFVLLYKVYLRILWYRRW